MSRRVLIERLDGAWSQLLLYKLWVVDENRHYHLDGLARAAQVVADTARALAEREGI